MNTALGVGLNAAVHEVFRRHGNALQPRPHERHDRQAVETARTALRYAAGVARVFEALHDVKAGSRRLERNGTDIRLPFAIPGTIEREAWKAAHSGPTEPDRPSDFAVIEILQSRQGVQAWNTMPATILFVGDDAIHYRVNESVGEIFTDCAVRATSRTELPGDIEVGGYTLDEFRTFYRYLYLLLQ